MPYEISGLILLGVALHVPQKNNKKNTQAIVGNMNQSYEGNTI